MNKNLVISCRDLRKTYAQGDLNVPVLNGVNLEVTRGERIAIVGASGSGKSTLLHLLGGLDTITGGSVNILGQDVTKMNETQRGELPRLVAGGAGTPQAQGIQVAAAVMAEQAVHVRDAQELRGRLLLVRRTAHS